jgi:hypothetical protein
MSLGGGFPSDWGSAKSAYRERLHYVTGMSHHGWRFGPRLPNSSRLRLYLLPQWL